MTTPINSKSQLYTFATKQLGFDDCRFTSAAAHESFKIYQDWIEQGFHGDMTYLENHLPIKATPESLLKDARSAIVVIKNYKNTSIRQLSGRHKIARYAVGRDYHLTLMEKLDQLITFTKELLPGCSCYAGVDSRPIAERSYALKSGVGFLGKNTMVIKPGFGSYFFIGVVFLNHLIEEDSPLKWDCGNCRLCLDACPTGALLGDFTMDARRCISYQTIEQKTPLTTTEIKQAQGWLFGCDICQEVCPYNHDNTPLTNWMDFKPESGVGFDFFDKNPLLSTDRIPEPTPLFRSRKRIIANLQLLNNSSSSQENTKISEQKFL